MAVKVLSSQELVRKAVIEVANLPEPALQQVLEYIEVLKSHQTEVDKAAVAAAISVEVERLVTDIRSKPRAEIMTEFRSALEAIREQAVVQGTAIDGDWQGD